MNYSVNSYRADGLERTLLDEGTLRQAKLEATKGITAKTTEVYVLFDNVCYVKTKKDSFKKWRVKD